MLNKNVQSPKFTEDYKMKSEQYLEVIEAQKLIIKRLQKSIVVLKRKNQELGKQNRELQSSHSGTMHFDTRVAPSQQLQSEVLQHPLDQQTLNISELSHSVAPSASKSTPILPPKSPHRQSPEVKQGVSKTSASRRPPVLKLAKSNYTSLHSNILDIQKEQLESNTIASPIYQSFTNVLSDPSSPSSSASSSSASNSPLLESDAYLSSSLPKSAFSSHLNEQASARYSSIPKSQINKQNQQEPIRHSTNSTPLMNKSKSEPSTPVKPRTPRFDSLLAKAYQTSTATTIKNDIPDVDVKVVSYSLKTCHRGREASVFTIGLFRKEDTTEMWRVEKSLSDLILLDSTLKESSPTIASHIKRLPEKSLFSSHAPAKVDERKDMIEEYLQQVVSLKSNDLQPLLQDFLSSDRIQYLPITLTNDIRIKQGYLTKKGKKIGGWKARYFVLENTGLLKYYESKNGTFIGTIKLSDSQVASQVQFDSGHNNPYRHAFVIFDSTSNRHIFCADSDQDRDSWVEALHPYTSQTHITQDIIDHCFAEDKGMDQFFAEPSSPVEVAENQKLPPAVPSKDIAMDSIFRQPSTLPTAKSNATENTITKILSNESSGTSSDEANEDKKPKQKNNRRSFWSRKMFGLSTVNDSLPPISPQSTVYDYNQIQAISDFEETRGEKQVFGISLVDAVALSRINESYDLPAIVHRCIEYLEAKDALFEEGIYRLSGSSAKVKALKKRFNDAGDVKLLNDINEYHDVHAIAGLLKMWLRELPENVLTEAALPGFLGSTHIANKQDRSREVRRLVSLLPSENYTLLRSLCAHLIRVIENSDKNKMTLRNICIVFSATLGIPSGIFTSFLVEFDYVFWTDRCTDDETEAALELEDTINSYMQTPDEEPPFNPLIQRFTERQEVHQVEGLRRNSIHYEDSAPREFISLEKQLEGVYRESAYDESHESDGEPEVAYIASRHDANNKQL